MGQKIHKRMTIDGVYRSKLLPNDYIIDLRNWRRDSNYYIHMGICMWI